MSQMARVAALGAATLAEAWPAARIMSQPPRPLAPAMTLAGPAYPLRARPGDNLALHLAMAEAAPGMVLVLDHDGDLGHGPFGEIMALGCQCRGLAGLITNGAVRDSQAIVALGLPVFACGLAIHGTQKRDAGMRDVPVALGGVTIAPGEIVVADADGIAVFAAADLEQALAAAEARHQREAAMMARLRGGETTKQVLNL